MKKIYLLIVIFAITFNVNKLFSQLIDEENPRIKEMKNEWMEQSHRIEKPFNWKLIEFSNQAAFQFDLINKMSKTDKPLQVNNKFADGLITAEWIEKGSNNLAGRIHTADIDFDNNIIYAASSGGNVWKGDINGSDWKCLNNSLKFPDIRAVKFKLVNNANRVMIAKNGQTGFYFTENEGITWKSATGLENAANWGNIKRAVFGADFIALLINEWDYTAWKSITSVYISNDNGNSFYRSSYNNLSQDVCDIWCDESTNNFYFLNGDTLNQISNLGKINKQSIYNSSINKVKFRLLKGSVNNSVLSLITAGNQGDSTFFYESSDYGKNWLLKSSVKCNTFETNSFHVSKINKNIIAIGGVEVYKTYDGGVVWNKQNGWGEYYNDIKTKLHADIPSINSFIDKQGNEAFTVGTDGGLYISYDQLKSVNNISLNNLNVSQYYSSYSYKGKTGITFAGAQDQGFQKSIIDSGSTLKFEQTISGDYGHLTSSDGGDHLWTVYPGFAMLYWNINNPVMNAAFWNFEGKNWLWMPPIVADYSDPTSAFIASGGSTSNITNLWRLTQNGNNIENYIYSYDFSEGNGGNKITAIAQSPINYSYMYVMTDNNVFYNSTNDGDSWNKLDSFKTPGNHYFYGNCIIPSSKVLGRIWIFGSNYSSPGAYVSNDNGKSFIKIDSGLAKTLIYKAAISEDEKFIFAATEAGPFVYSVEKNLWYNISNEISPQQTFWSVEYLKESKIARFVTYGRGIWDFKVNSYSGIEENEIEIKNNPVLNVSPNPASKNALIKFNLSKNSIGKLSIFSLEGKLIKELQSGIFESGENEINFNLNSEKNIQNGVYLCVLYLDGKSYFTKILVNKD